MKFEELKQLVGLTYELKKEIENVKKAHLSKEEKEDQIYPLQNNLNLFEDKLKEEASRFSVPILSVVEKLNEYFKKNLPDLEVEYDISDEDFDKVKFFYSAYLLRKGVEIGTIFTNGYYYDDLKNSGLDIDEFVKTNKSNLSYVNILPLIKSSEFFKQKRDAEITKVIETPTFQTALWEVVLDNEKAKNNNTFSL